VVSKGLHPDIILAILGDDTMTEEERLATLILAFSKTLPYTEAVARGEEE